MLTTRDLAYKGFTVTIRSDEIWFTVRDAADEPCGTIERPHRGVTSWQAHAPTGQSLGPCIGPSMALRKIAIYHGA